jgi:hypothetical protein
VSPATRWGKIFRVAATAGFAASGALHLSTFTPFPAAYGAAVALALFVIAFVLLAAMVVRMRDSGAPARGQGTLRVVEWRKLLGLVPGGPKRAGLAVVAYVLMNLALSLLVPDEGAASVRMLSGQLLLFYLIPLMYFRFVEPRLRDGGGPSDP